MVLPHTLFATEPKKISAPKYERYGGLLHDFVCSNGVNYKALKQSNRIEDVGEEFVLDAEGFKALSEQDRLAYWLNLYNYQTMRLILAKYPLKSIKEIADPWKVKIVNAFGKQVSLDYIETEIIRKEFSEPRIHFALNCASYSCPPLQIKPFVGSDLESQLENATYLFLSDPKRNKVENNTLKISQIFKWYGDDFKAKYGSPEKFISLKLKLNGTFDVQYLDYSWKLNDAPGCKL